MEILSTSNIAKLINQAKSSEYTSRVQPLVDKKLNYRKISNTWGDLKSNLSKFKTLLENLKNPASGGAFTSKVAQLSSEEYFSATAGSGASISGYDLKVNQLAQSDRVMSNTVNSSDLSGLTAGSYTFNVTSGEVNKDIQIDVAGTENQEELMEMISEAINESLGEAVSASVFSPTEGESKLSVVSKETGKANAISIKDITGNALNSIGMSFNSRTEIAGDGSTGGYSSNIDDLNAKLTFNGIAVERSSNVITDLVSDVTLTLKKAMDEGVPKVNLIIKNNVDSFKTKIKDFVTEFNNSYKYVKNNYYADENGNRGVFVGDATAQGLMQKFSEIAYKKVEGLEDEKISYLAEIGVTFDPDSGLTISDDEKLTKALKDDPEQVSNLFTSENGVANKLFNEVENYVKKDGTISSLIDSYDKSISFLADKITSKEKIIDLNAGNLRKQYEDMQVQMMDLLEMKNAFSLAGIGMY